MGKLFQYGHDDTNDSRPDICADLILLRTRSASRADSACRDCRGHRGADILEGILSREPRRITDTELGDWLEYTPELDGLLDRLPFLRDRINRLPELPKRPRFRP